MRKNLHLLGSILMLFLCGQLLMAQPQLVKDIPDDAREFFSVNGILYFFSGDELWKSEGTSGTTVLVKKLDEEVKYTTPAILTLGNYFFFTTTAIDYTTSIWRSDGTSGNTEKIIWGEYYRLLGTFQDKVIFQKYYSSWEQPSQLWQVDLPQQEMYIQTLGDDIIEFSATDDHMYFTGDYTGSQDGRFPLWVSDGTENGTYTILRDNHSYAKSFLPFDNTMYVTQVQDNGYMPEDFSLITPQGIDEIWTSSNRGWYWDRTEIALMIPYNNKIMLFVRPYASTSYELWEFDPLTNKVTNIRSLLYFAWWVSPDYINALVINNTMVFNTGKKVYRSNGTNTGTFPIADMYHIKDPEFTKVGDLLFYINHASASPASYNEELELYQSGLFSQNTSSVRKLFGNTGNYGHTSNLTEAGGKLFFTLESNTGDKTLWIYDPVKPADGSPYFTVVNADTDQDIQWLKNGDTIVKPAGLNIALRFNPAGSPGSVQFWNGPYLARTESSAPFSFPGDNNGNYQPWTNANPGNYTFTAIPYSLPGGNGVAGPSTAVSFTIVTPAPKVPPVVSAGPDREITLPTDSVYLYGSATDPDGYIVERKWTLVSGVDDWDYYMSHPNEDTTKVVFNPDEPNTYYFALEAIDNDGLYGADTVQIIVNDFPARVVGFILVNTDNNEDIRGLNYHSTIDLSTLPPNLSIRAFTLPNTIQKVIFDYDNGRMIRTENVPPYALFGNTGASYIPGQFTEGYHDLNAVPYLNDTEYRGNSVRLHVTRSIPGALNKFVLVRADTDQDLFDLTHNTTLYLDELPAQLNVRVETNTSSIGSVTFSLNNTNRTENVAPYSVFGDIGGNFNGGTFPVGDNYIEAKAYSGSNGTGSYLNGIYVPFRVRASRNARLAADYYESGTQVSIVPNPSADRFAIRIEATVNEHTSVEIFNASGLPVSKLYNGPGQNMELQWDATQVPAGVYFCHVRSNNAVKTYKLMVVR